MAESLGLDFGRPSLGLDFGRLSDTFGVSPAFHNHCDESGCTLCCSEKTFEFHSPECSRRHSIVLNSNLSDSNSISASRSHSRSRLRRVFPIRDVLQNLFTAPWRRFWRRCRPNNAVLRI